MEENGFEKKGPMTTAEAYAKVAKSMGLTAKDVKVAVTGFMEVAAKEAVRHGSSKVAGILKMKLHVKKALPERKGWNRFLDEQCTFKARPATKTVRTKPLPKLIKMVNTHMTRQKADQDDQKATKQKADQDGQQATKQKPDQAKKQKADRGGQQLMKKS